MTLTSRLWYFAVTVVEKGDVFSHHSVNFVRNQGDDASTQQDDGTDHFDAVNLEGNSNLSIMNWSLKQTPVLHSALVVFLFSRMYA